MSVNRTFTVTVVSTGSGNKYFIDGVQQPTLELVEGGTFRFDVSDSSMGPHPFKFSTTSGGTHSGGSEYTTGVTTSGTTGQSGAYVQIVVADSAPTLYYYCQYHSGMGGQANTPNSDFWGAGNWSANLWGISEAFTSGWGVDAWGIGGAWGQSNDEVVSLTGLALTSSVGTPISGAQQGWGRAEWGEEPWSDSNNPVVTLSGQATTSSLGSPTINTEINTGWGSDTWGTENWGSSGITVILTGVEATTATGEDVSWGKQTWGSATTGWGGEYYLQVADVMGLTGLSTTSSVGTPTAISDLVLIPTGQSSTSTVGSITISFNIDVALTGVSATSATGALAPADVMGLTGLQTESFVGTVTSSQNPIITLTGLSTTASTGTIDPADQVMGLTGLLATSSTGTIDPADQVMGLTGVSATASVSPIGVAPIGYQRITATQDANYSRVTQGT